MIPAGSRIHAMFGRRMEEIDGRPTLEGPLTHAARFEMVAYVSNSIDGPFHESPVNRLLLARGHAYF